MDHFSLLPKVRQVATPPSILNDVFGPTMIGPSSSHTGAAFRIGRLCLDLLGGKVTRLTASYNKGTALANTHTGQGTDRGLYGALLGWDIVDARMRMFDSQIVACLETAGIQVTVEYPELGETHASFYRLTIGNEQEEHLVEAVSTGGGMFKILRIDGADVIIEGDFHELLVFCTADEDQLREHLETSLDADFINVCKSGKATFIEVKCAKEFDGAFVKALLARPDVSAVKVLAPVLPTLSRRDLKLPFLSASEMLKYLRQSGEELTLWQLALRYESARGGESEEKVWRRMEEVAKLMRQSIEFGIAGTDYQDRLLPPQTPLAIEAIRNGVVPNDVMAKMILYTTAIMDAKSGMGVFVAAPTAGSCGTTPGAIFGMADFHQMSNDQIVQALLAAGMIGIFIAAGSTFSAELAGCMAETGASGAMAAAGMVTLLGGNVHQALTAAGVTIETGLGLICDMVADRVEAPCLAKNLAAVMRAYGATLTSLMGYAMVIPLDEAIQAMDRVGKLMPDSVCCTGVEGLCGTCTGTRLHTQMVKLSVSHRPPGSLLPKTHEIEGT